MALLVGILSFIVGVAIGMALKDMLLAQLAKLNKKGSK